MFLLAPETTPLPGVSLDALMQTLHELALDAGNVPAKSALHIPTDLLSDYLLWVDSAERRLAHMLPRYDVESLLLTRRHWSLRSMDGGSAGLASAVHLELEQRQRVLVAARSQLESFDSHWDSRSGVIAVPDTNVFLDHEGPIDSWPWREIMGIDSDLFVVIPLLVVDELDKAKRHNNKKLQQAARHSLRWLESLREARGTSLASASVNVEILADPARHVRLGDSDYEILDRAALLDRLTPLPVCVVTQDLGMRVRAGSLGIESRTAQTRSGE